MKSKIIRLRGFEIRPVKADKATHNINDLSEVFCLEMVSVTDRGPQYAPSSRYTYSTEYGGEHNGIAFGTARAAVKYALRGLPTKWITITAPLNDELMDIDDDDFQACSGCDGHDACVDFGCAIEAGLGHLVRQPL